MSAISIYNWEKVFRNLDFKLSQVQYAGQLRQNLAIVSGAIPSILQAAEKADYKNIQANGFRSFVMFCLQFCQLIDSNMNNLTSKYEDLLSVSRVVIQLTKVVQELCEGTKNQTLTLGTNIGPFAFSTSWFTLVRENEKDFATLFASYNGFWLPSSFQTVWSRIFTGMALLNNPLSLLKSRKKQGVNVVDMMIHATIEYPIRMLDSLSQYWLPKLESLRPHLKIRTKSVYISPSSPYVINEKSFKIEKVHSRTSSDQVRCLVLTSRWRKSNDQRVIFHVHGGGFIVGNPEIDKSAYLKYNTEKLNGATTVAVQYTVSKPFPAGLQNVLDAYLWLTTDKSVEKVLGFQPKDILVTGESAGGNLALSLVLCLNDIKNVYGLDPGVLPKSILTLYGLFLPIPQMSPSRVLFFPDAITPANFFLIMVQQYAGIPAKAQSRTEVGLFSTIKSYLSFLIHVITLSSPKRQLPWYLTSKSNAVDFTRMAMEKLTCPYASPLLYKRFKEIQIPLTIVTAQYCFLQDDSVALAKLWKGPVSFHVFENEAHGFFHFGPSEKQREQLVEILKNALPSVSQVTVSKSLTKRILSFVPFSNMLLNQ